VTAERATHLTWEIAVAANQVADAAADVSTQECDAELLEAVLADYYRDAGVVPLRPDLFALVTAGMEEAHWQRFAVIVGMLARPELRLVLPAVSQRLPVREQIERAMVTTAKAVSAIHLRIFSSSMVRAEELARRVARGLGIGFEGETLAESTARLAKIDYTRLLASVDAARASAEEQMAELLKRQEAEDNRIARQRRGKW
jgi:hypothetical protein